MRFITFSDVSGERAGCIAQDDVIDFTAADPSLPRSVLDLVRLAASSGLEQIRHACAKAPHLALADVHLLAPIPRPAKNIFCVGKNYHEHAKEFHRSGFDASAGANAVPDAPIVFSKPATTVVGPGAPILGYLDPTASVDYENELAVVIGKAGRGISEADAFAHVFGYTIVNDVTSRTLQHRHKQWFLGKGIDSFCPMGPSIVTADEIPEVGRMRLLTRVNDEVRQDALVRDLIFSIPQLIACISASITLEPGDIIATGTPAGVGIGFAPPKFLRTGDVVTVSIEPLGSMTNKVL